MTSVVSLSPHRLYMERIIFMAALLIPACFLSGLRAAAVCAVSVLSCMAVDCVCCRIRRIQYDIKDCSVPFWGLSLAMLMPVSMPYPLVILSSIICIAVGKHIFGGSDNIVFSPPAISAAFLIICYPSYMLYCPPAGEIMPVFSDFSGIMTRSVEYTIKLGNIPVQSWINLILGNAPGAIGTVHLLVILMCGLCMTLRRSASISAGVSCLATVSAIAFFFPRIDVSGWESIGYELCSGYLFFGMIFLTAEPNILPKRPAARAVYGIVLGYATMMFRYFGQVEGCFVFALLITDALSGSFDVIVENLLYWKTAYLASYEHNKETVRHGSVKLTDTQEIVLPEKYRYNTPPIDGEIKKHRRKSKEGDENGDE